MKPTTILVTVAMVATALPWVVVTTTSPAEAQQATPQQAAKQQEAIENLEELLGQYEQGEYANQTSGLAAAQARITELEMALGLLSKQHEDLQAEHAALQERCSQR